MASLNNIVGSRFNSHLDQKGLVYIAELHATNTSEGSMHKKMDEFKPYISDSHINIEMKGVDVIKRTNATHWLGSSNNESCLKLGETNRRHIALKTSSCRMGDTVYFNNLHTYFNQESANHFYSWLYYLGESILPDPYKLIKTDLMVDMVNMSLPDPVLFIRQLESGETTMPVTKKTMGDWKKDSYIIDDNENDHDKLLIQKGELFKCFKYWCEINSIKSSAAKYFYSEMKKLKLNDVRPKGQTASFYRISRKWITEVENPKKDNISLLEFLPRSENAIPYEGQMLSF